MKENKSPSSFYNLEVYQITYQAAITVIKNILPKLPKEERFDLDNQLRRSAKAVPRLIAEGYSKRYQKKGYQSLLDDATEESNECIVSLSQVKDIYNIEPALCINLIDVYDKAARQLQNLALAWANFKQRKTKDENDRRDPNDTDTENNTFKSIKILFIIFLILCSSNFGLCGEDNLEVKGKIEAQSLTIRGGDTFPAAPVKGEVFYRSDEDQYYTFDGTSWQALGGQDKVVATRVVAAVNSDDTNRTADYICDGTDDQQEINRAINDLGTVGGAVYLLEGTYNISAALLEGETIVGVVPHTNTTIIGTGAGTVLNVVGAVSYLIDAQAVNNVTLSQFKIQGDGTQTTYGIYFYNGEGLKVNNLWFENVGGLGSCDIYLSYANKCILTNNVMSGGGLAYDGINLLYSNNCIISGNLISDYESRGIQLYNSANNNVVTANSIQGIDCLSIQLYGLGVSNNIVMANNIQGGGDNGCGGAIAIGEGDNNVISNNIIQGQISGGNGVLIYGGCCDSVGAGSNVVTGNMIKGNAGCGIRLQGATSSTITGNLIYENGATTNCGGPTCAGIMLVGGLANNNLISSNRIYDSDSANPSYGIYLLESFGKPNNTYIFGNYIDGAGYATRIYDDGTNTAYTDKTKLTFEPVAGCADLVNGGTLTPNGPTSYIRLNPTQDITLGNPAIAIGKSPGDLLILENTASFSVKFTLNPNNLRLVKSPLYLYQNEVLTLLWDGTEATCCWVQTGGKDY